ncbi:MAG: hypothetical protein IJ054_00840 [Lachnospiraceae bacterium]|nr:hypothetical protein [Lachnospiraceae bacterium]MBQ9234716.1 hypothetical protein [Lachnospiraceae bacterium]
MDNNMNNQNNTNNNFGYLQTNNQQQDSQFYSGYGNYPYKAPKGPKKPLNKKALIIALAAIAAIVGIFIFVKTRKTTIDLNKYVKVEFSGYDGKGKAYVSFDKEKFLKDYSDKIERTSKYKNVIKQDWGGLYKEVLRESTPAEDFLDECVNGNLDVSYELSNGDVVVYTWDVDTQKALDYFNCKVKIDSKTFTVAGLEAVKTFNPFDYVDVTFTGTAPDSSVKIEKKSTSDEMQYISFSADKESGVSNGDTVTVTADYAYCDEDDFIEKFGSVISENEREYTVEGLSHYVVDVNEIPADMIEKMTNQGADALRSQVANSWKNPEDLLGAESIGYYFLYPKQGMKTYDKNYIYIIYKVTAEVSSSESDEDGESTEDTEDNGSDGGNLTYYYYIQFKDIIMLDDGTCSVDLSDYKIPEGSAWDRNIYSGEIYWVSEHEYVTGYGDLDTMFNNLVVTKVEEYEYTSTVQE